MAEGLLCARRMVTGTRWE
ncbi:UNVERIFIED_CONTAM: hypothetical protein GTU68_007956 [Idotea baltica]|nr:hypothetical protein [Idotea baltica]